MRRVVLFVLLGVTLSASAAPAPLPRRDRGEKESLDGEWKLVADKSGPQGGGGGGGPGRQPENFTMTIRGNKMTFRIQEGPISMDAEAELKTGGGPYPRTMDVRFVRIRINGEVRNEQQTSLGLYRLEGNTLTLSMGHGDNKRPTSLDDRSAEVMVFTRIRR
jgi:uncharacterized protein (TIGR03067 family)